MAKEKRSVEKIKEVLGIKKPSEEIAFGTMPKNEPDTKQREVPKPVEEWIWVDGYKATEKDMTCRGYQYEMNKCFDISDDKPVEECVHGFHLCLLLDDVFRYYRIGDKHRFFKVKALVRKKDVCEYGNSTITVGSMHYNRISFDNHKLVAKSIMFVEELTADEILRHYGVEKWSYEDKQLALEIGVKNVSEIIATRELVTLGYSEAFAKLIIASGKFKTAKAVGTQDGLSMDMKVWFIFNGGK